MSKLPKINELNTCHFVTTKVWQNIWLFKEDKYCQIIIDNLNFYRKKFNFKLIAYAIIPWHLHLILMLSRKFNDISKVIQDFKRHTAKEIIYCLKTGRRKPSLSPYFNAASEGSLLPEVGYNVASENSLSPRAEYNNARSKTSVRKDFLLPIDYKWINRGKIHTPTVNKIWQKNFYDFNIYLYQKLEQKVDYVNNNAVKHNLVIDPVDYKYSSARNFYLNDQSISK